MLSHYCCCYHQIFFFLKCDCHVPLVKAHENQSLNDLRGFLTNPVLNLIRRFLCHAENIVPTMPRDVQEVRLHVVQFIVYSARWSLWRIIVLFCSIQRKLRRILSRIGGMRLTKWHLKIFTLLSLWPGWKSHKLV